MPRTCTICKHPELDAINKALVDSVSFSYRHIAAQFNVSTGSLQRHKASHLPASLVQAKDAQEVAQADNIMSELQCCFERVNLLFDACDRWLRDPEDPTRYEIGPRAEDISVVYSFRETGPRGGLITIRKKAKLSTLLKQVNDHHGNNLDFEMVETKHADPRELVLKTAERLQGQTELLARLLGELQSQPVVNVLVTSPEWIRTRTVLMRALEPFIDARIAVAKALSEAENVL